MMDPQITAALIGGALGLAGGVAAALATLAIVPVQRYLQRRGELRYVISDFKWEEKPYLREYTFYVKVFNERGVGIGVRDVNVEFLREGKEVVGTDRPRDSLTGFHADFLNFPSREWVVRKLKMGDIELKEGNISSNYKKLQWLKKECDKARLVVRLPDGKEPDKRVEMDMRLDGEEKEGSLSGARFRWW